jgi:hypothetical protein
MNKITIIVISALIIVVSAGSFYGGMKYDQNKNSPLGKGLDRTRFQQIGGNGTNRMGGIQSDGLVNGDIISQDNKSMTIKLRNGGSKIIFLSESTSISKMASGSLEDLVAGQQVTVTGIANQDGSITAQSIQIRPTLTPTAMPK